MRSPYCSTPVQNKHQPALFPNAGEIKLWASATLKNYLEICKMSQQQQFHRDGSPVAAMELREPNETTSLSTLHGYAPREGHFSENQKRMGGRYSRIAWNFSMLAIPMFLFVAILLGLVFHYQIQTKDPPFTNLRLPDQQNDSNVYYVRISSTILVFIASWSSSLAPTLASFALALVSYPIAGKYLRAARTERIDGLMTPYQLFLTLRLLDGGVVRALWSWLRYVVGWRKHRERQARPLSTTASVALLALCLGYVFPWLRCDVADSSVELLFSSRIHGCTSPPRP